MRTCSRKVLAEEFFVHTWSGDDQSIICAVRGEPEIRHWVEVWNLRLYLPKRVRCVGLIDANQPVIRFIPDQPTDTAVRWRRYLNRLDENTPSKIIPACVFEAVDDAAGVENIETMVTVEWVKSGKTQTIQLPINVSTD